jgi:hypothetical protein
VEGIRTIEELPTGKEIIGKRKWDGEEEELGTWNKKSILRGVTC